MTDNLPKGAAVLIVNNGRVLSVRRGNSDKWGLPGGKLEIGETTSEAAVRECAEETGVVLERNKGQLIYGGICNADHLSKKEFWVDAYLYELPENGKAHTMELENIVDWLEPEDFLARSSFPEFHRKMFQAVPHLLSSNPQTTIEP